MFVSTLPYILAKNSLFQRIRDQRQNLLILIQQQHDAQIPQPLIRESWTGYQLETFNLTEMSRVAEHVDVEQFGNVVVSGKGVFFFE